MKITSTHRLEKISDDKFGGKHPRHINEGYTSESVLIDMPVVGQHFYFGNLRTSTVQEIIDKNTFKTSNSTYRLTELDY